MSDHTMTHVITIGAALALSVSLLVTAPGTASPGPPQSDRSAGSTPGHTASGGKLDVRLADAADGRIQVSWKRPAVPSRIRNYVVQVGPNRGLRGKTRSTVVDRRQQSALVSRAFGATASSGNFSFVRVVVKRKHGGNGSSSATWIQTPPDAACTSPNRVRVGTFNVRTWAEQTADAKRFSWDRRGPGVIREIRRSHAGVVAIQEASGRGGQGHGKKRQNVWIVQHLNAASPQAQWRDGVSDDLYHGGLVGTRLLYDASRFTELDSGLADVTTRGSVRRSPVPWARLRSVDGDQPSFVMLSTHLQRGETPKDFAVRGRQAEELVGVVRSLRDRFGDQVILGGDLNSTIYSKPYNNVQRKLLQAGFYDAFATTNLHGAAYPTTNDFDFPVRATPHRRDYLMSFGDERGSCEYRNLYYRSASKAASDHFMQVAVLPLPG